LRSRENGCWRIGFARFELELCIVIFILARGGQFWWRSEVIFAVTLLIWNWLFPLHTHSSSKDDGCSFESHGNTKNAGRRTRKCSACWYWQTWGWLLLVAPGIVFFCVFLPNLTCKPRFWIFRVQSKVGLDVEMPRLVSSSVFNSSIPGPPVVSSTTRKSKQWRSALQAQFSNAASTTAFRDSHGRSVQRKAGRRASGGEWGYSQCSLDILGSL